MASVNTAESAVADNARISRLLEFEQVLALTGDRGFCFESGDLKINVFPASKASSPSGAKGSWRQPVAAAAATKAPMKHRAAKREPLNPGSACYGASSATKLRVPVFFYPVFFPTRDSSRWIARRAA